MKHRPIQKIVLSFIFVILSGTILLYYFGFTNELTKTPFITALFTSVSAVCVTGLSIINLENEMNFTGQAITLLLIQLGGLGLLTFSNWIILWRRGRLKLSEYDVTKNIMGDLKLSAGFTLKRVMFFVFSVELLGAILLFFRFSYDYPISKALWLALFHSISAFCNAGFSIFGNNLENYKGDFIVNSVIMAEIVLGGIGFFVAVDVMERLHMHFKGVRTTLSLHSKTAIVMTFILITAGFLFILMFEWTNPSFSNETLLTRIYQALFTSITARTAGFNTLPISELTNISLVFIIGLMAIGASPGSTGGGIKTTTFAIISIFLAGQIFHKQRTELFNRNIQSITISNALAVAILYCLTVIVSVFLLQFSESGFMPHSQGKFDLLDQIFEVVSALSTVGLSTGITAKLSNSGLSVLMGCMFIGRIGPLVLLASLIETQKKHRANYTLPDGNILVG